MKNIYETDGLSRDKRAERAPVDLPLQVLEDNLPALLNRVLRKSKEFAGLYHYQPIVVLSEIEQIDTAAIQEVFYFLQDDEEKIYYIRTLLIMMEGWRRRLEAFSLYTGSLQLLRDLEGQIETNLAPWFPHFESLYDVDFKDGQLGNIWRPPVVRSINEVQADGFFRRFFYLYLASVTVLHKKLKVYKEEIYSTGTMDPSLAVLISFLKNYGEIVSGFNRKWSRLPLFYYHDILKVRPRAEKKGKLWLWFRKKALAVDFIIPAGTCFPTMEADECPGYRLTDDVIINNLSAEKVSLVVAERNCQRYPEAALNFITSLYRTDLPENSINNIQIGIELKSDIFLLSEGTREVTINCFFTDESLSYLSDIIIRIAGEQLISTEEARLKMGSDAFSVEITTGEGWQPVQNPVINLEPQWGMMIRFVLDSTFPVIATLNNNHHASVRLIMNPGAWLFPYSWARKMLIMKIVVKVDVSGIRNIQMCNELGIIDTNQPFPPFGALGQLGSWLVFGNYELTRKRVSRIGLNFHWQHLPDITGGLEYYYKEYGKQITNRSFRVTTQYLLKNEWKPTPGNEEQYLFRTQDTESSTPLPDGKLSDESSISFTLPEIDDFGIRQADEFIFGHAHSGFFRMMLTAPDIGFGEKEYRRLFTEIMMNNSRRRRKLRLPQEPFAPVMDSPRLNYSAEETCYFAVGQQPNIGISYIRPLSDKVELTADTSRPVPLAEGPDDEANLLIAFSGATGENILRFYIDTEPLTRLQRSASTYNMNWYYKDVLSWVKLQPSFVLKDNTGNLRHSGLVELQLPLPVSPQMLDTEGLFWICLGINRGLENCATVKNIYTQIAEAEVAVESCKDPVLPGLESYMPVCELSGGHPPETERDMSIRLSERIAHRNRALLTRDYEQLILQEFPQLQKVKCLSGVDAVNVIARPGSVTVALVNGRLANEWPVCEDKLLDDVRSFILKKTSPFVHLSVVNPIYEEITVFCGISLKTGFSAGTVIAEINRNIRQCIAPWADGGMSPIFGYSFSINDLQSIIVGNPGVKHLHGIKLIHQTENRAGDFYFNEYMPDRDESFRIVPSEPWAISVPADNQYIIVCTPEEWRHTIEYGDLELGKTFVIE